MLFALAQLVLPFQCTSDDLRQVGMAGISAVPPVVNIAGREVAMSSFFDEYMPVSREEIFSALVLPS